MPDVRLALPAIALWTACAVLIGMPSVAGWTALAAGVGSAAALVLALVPWAVRRRPGGGHRAAVATVLAAICLGAAVVGMQSPGREDAALDAAADDAASIDLLIRIERTPQRMSAAFGDQPRWSARGTSAGPSGGVPVRLQFDAPVRQARLLANGAVVRAHGAIVRDEPGKATTYTLRVAAGEAPTVEQQPPPWLAWAAAVRTAFANAAARTPGDGGALLPGLAIGDETSLPPELDEAMKASSLSHLTAVSGANCALVIGLVFLAARAVGAGRRVRIAVAAVALLAFVGLVGPGPSVIRAAAMAGVLLLALARGRPADGVPALSLAALVLLVHDPWLARDYGFALSILATAGLLILAGPLSGLLRRWMPRSLALAIAVPTAAQLACQPVLILLAPTLPLWGIPANLLAEPAAPVATVLGCLACALLPCAPALGELLVRLAWVPSAWIAQVATVASGLPGGALPWVPGVVGVVLSAAVLVAVLLVVMRGAPRVVAVVAAVALCAGGVAYLGVLGGGAVGRALAVPGDWRVAACDVGQGDGVLLRDGDAVAMIDVGREPAPAAACLDRLGVGTIDLLVLTHFDADHVGGIAGVGPRVRRALSQRPVRGADERTLAVLAGQGVPIEQGHAGMSGHLGSTGWRLLWPPAVAGAPASDEGTGNAGSLTLEAEGGGLRSIFLGDLGEEAQNALLATRTVRPVDVVKVAHHGSADQSAALYRALRARVGLVSVGARNGYGHPTASALRMLADAGTTPVRTDERGLILVSPGSPGSTGIRVWSEHAATTTDGGRPYPGEATPGHLRAADQRGDTWRPEAAAEAERPRRAQRPARSRSCRGTRCARLRSCSSPGRRGSSRIARFERCAMPSRPTIPASRSVTSTPATTRPASSSRSRAPPCSASRG